MMVISPDTPKKDFLKPLLESFVLKSPRGNSIYPYLWLQTEKSFAPCSPAAKALLASFLQLAFRLFPKAFVVNPIGVDRIGPLAVNEEITNLIEDISIGFQHVWLDQEPQFPGNKNT